MPKSTGTKPMASADEGSRPNPDWTDTMKTNPPRFVVCLNADGHPLDLTLHKIYRTIPDDRAHDVSCYRIIDDTDEDYLYPTHRFAPIELPVALQASLERTAETRTA